jgi:zinc transporter ZupT
VSAAFLVAVFISNVPESIAATSGLLQSGWTRARVIGLWVMVMVVSGLSALAGYALLDGASPHVIAFVLSFAAGAILTMLADTIAGGVRARGQAGRTGDHARLCARVRDQRPRVAVSALSTDEFRRRGASYR